MVVCLKFIDTVKKRRGKIVGMIHIVFDDRNIAHLKNLVTSLHKAAPAL